jgi:hypothetical protein
MASGPQTCRTGAPPWGTWFGKQALAFRAQESRPEHVVVAWALGDGKRGYVYGLFKSMERFYEYLRETTPAQRVGFEMIQEKEPCLLYLDVEWVGEADCEHAGIRRMCSLLRAYCREKYQFDPLRLYVTCGSREHKKLYKNSYHVHANVHFVNNNNGDMKAFVADFVGEKLRGDEWTWGRESGGSVHKVDLCVYTKNRLMRLPWNCKLGQPPHVRISGDPTDEEDPFQSRYEFADPESWRPCIVSRAAPNDDVFTGPRRTAPAHAGGNVRARKRKHEGNAADVPPDRDAASGANAAGELPECVRTMLVDPTTSQCYHEPVRFFPACVKMQMDYNFLCKEDVVELRVSRPLLCAPLFFQCESKRHAHSSNGCMVLVVRQRKPALVKLLGEVQVYVKCFCEKEPGGAFGLLGVEDMRLKELLRYDSPGARAKYLRYVVETQYGIDGVADAKARRDVRDAYRRGNAERNARMRDPELKVAWAHVFACNSGWRAWPLQTREGRDFFAPRAV